MDQSENFVAIPIPPLDEDDELDLLEYVSSFRDQLYPALDLKVDDSDGRTTYADHSFVEAYLEGECLVVHYEVETETYHGCKDIDAFGTVGRHVIGRGDGSRWNFSCVKYPEDRSTLEEF